MFHLECFSFPSPIGLDFLHHFVENLTSECMETFIVASISFFWLERFLCLFQASFVGCFCTTCSFDSEVFGLGFLCADQV
jgi:hypothetical protein